MGSFAVQPKALEAFANVVGSSSSGQNSLEFKYLWDYGNYIDDHLKISGEGLLFQWLSPQMADIKSALSSYYSILSSTLIESGFNLEASAKTYLTTDAAQSEIVDAAYTPGAGSTMPVDGGHGGAVPDPSAKLAGEPSDENAVPDLVQELLDATGVLSESDLVIKILRWCGIDVFGWASDKLLGDHKQIAICKSALENLSEFDTVAAQAIRIGATTMLSQWSGNAANGANAYFTMVASALEKHASEVSQVASNLTALMAGIQEGVAALEGAITIALDAAIEAAAAVAAAGCLQEIPGVNILMDIIGSWKVYKVIKAVREVTDIWGKVWAAHEGIMGIIAGLAGGLKSYNISAEAPSVSYYNPAQGPRPTYDSPDDISRKGGPR